MANQNELKFDKRLLQRNLQSGAIARADVQGYLKALPDSQANAEVVAFDPSPSHPRDDRNQIKGAAAKAALTSGAGAPVASESDEPTAAARADVATRPDAPENAP